MEQNATNNEVKQVITDKVLPWYNKSYNILILMALLVVGYFVYTHQKWNGECVSKVSFVPATQTVVGEQPFAPTIQGEGEHYRYLMSSYKTKSEAMSACVKREKNKVE